MKIYHRVEYWKTYIPSDKVHYNHKAFENFSISHFGIDYKTSKEYRNNYNNETKKNIIQAIKNRIKQSQKYNEIVKDGYHKALYLNFNLDGIDCFIDR